MLYLSKVIRDWVVISRHSALANHERYRPLTVADDVLHRITAVLAVAGPRYLLVAERGEGYLVRAEELDVVLVYLHGDVEQRAHYLLELDKIRRLLYQRDLENTIVKVEVIHREQARYRGRICNHSENIVPLYNITVVLYTHPLRAQGRELSHAVQDVGDVSEHVLDLLRGLIRDARKCSECYDIREVIIVETADITRRGCSVSYPFNGVHGVLGYAETAREIVGRARKQVAYRDTAVAPHHALQTLAERAVSARTHNYVKAVLAGVIRRICGVGTALRDMHRDLKVCLVEFVYYLAELIADSGSASEQIYYKI